MPVRRMRVTSTGPAHVPDPDWSSVPEKPVRPRCGRVMIPYEKVWGALLDPVVCGRPQGHTGTCRSVQSLAKARDRYRQNWQRIAAQRRERRRFARLSLAEQIAEVVQAASAAAQARAHGPQIQRRLRRTMS